MSKWLAVSLNKINFFVATYQYIPQLFERVILQIWPEVKANRIFKYDQNENIFYCKTCFDNSVCYFLYSVKTEKWHKFPLMIWTTFPQLSPNSIYT